MKRLIFFSPISFGRKSSGISLRIKELESIFRNHGIKTAVYDSLKDYQENINDFIYIMVSTKADSISYNIAQNFKAQKLIVDLYTPIFLEKEAYLSKWKPQDWYTRVKMNSVVKKIILSGNYFIVANTRQKEYWLKTAKTLKASIDKDKIFVLPTGAPKPSTVNRQPYPRHSASSPHSALQRFCDSELGTRNTEPLRSAIISGWLPAARINNTAEWDVC